MTRSRPVLAVRRSTTVPARVERVGWLVLAVLACVLAHEATYQLVFGGAESYRAAMTLLGHDGYWLGLSVAVAVATLALIGVAAVQLRRLQREAASTPRSPPMRPRGRSHTCGSWVRPGSASRSSRC